MLQLFKISISIRQIKTTIFKFKFSSNLQTLFFFSKKANAETRKSFIIICGMLKLSFFDILTTNYTLIFIFHLNNHGYQNQLLPFNFFISPYQKHIHHFRPNAILIAIAHKPCSPYPKTQSTLTYSSDAKTHLAGEKVYRNMNVDLRCFLCKPALYTTDSFIYLP